VASALRVWPFGAIRERVIEANRLGDRIGHGLGPRGHPLLYERPRCPQVAIRLTHRLSDSLSEGRTKIQLGWKRLHTEAERRKSALHRSVAQKEKLVFTPTEGKRSGDKRLEVAAGSGGCHDEDPAHGRRR
jgi:hypothetical protein